MWNVSEDTSFNISLHDEILSTWYAEKSLDKMSCRQELKVEKHPDKSPDMENIYDLMRFSINLLTRWLREGDVPCSVLWMSCVLTNYFLCELTKLNNIMTIGKQFCLSKSLFSFSGRLGSWRTRLVTKKNVL